MSDSNTKTTPRLFQQIPLQVSEHVVSSMLHYSEEINLAKTNSIFYQCLNKNVQIKKLLHHVAYGEYENVKAMVEVNPRLLLQKNRVTISHSHLTFKNKTALQIAWYLKDTEMIELLQSHMDLPNIQLQQKAQYPEGYEAYKKIASEKINEGAKMLLEVFKTFETNDHFHKESRRVIQNVINYLQVKNPDETAIGHNIADELACILFKLYYINYDVFAMSEEGYSTLKHQYLWCHLLGAIQRYALAFVDIQAFRDGVFYTTKKKEEGSLQSRELSFKTWNHDKWYHLNFSSLVEKEDAGLGFDYAVYSGCMNYGDENYAYQLGMMYKNMYEYCQTKNIKLEKLMKNPVPKQAHDVSLKNLNP
jgi:hypothetical protein